MDDVDPGGVADMAGIRKGDFLLEVNTYQTALSQSGQKLYENAIHIVMAIFKPEAMTKKRALFWSKVDMLEMIACNSKRLWPHCAYINIYSIPSMWLGLDLSIMYLGLNVSFSFRKHCIHPIKVSISVIFITQKER
jgi:hypothetical protein